MEAKRLSWGLWQQIHQAINSSRPRSEVTYGQVIKRDEKNMLVWIKDLGNQPIPIVGFRMEVDYYDNHPFGNTTTVGTPVTQKVTKKTAKVRILLPEIGDTVVVLRQLGVHRLPKAVGIILSTNFEDQ